MSIRPVNYEARYQQPIVALLESVPYKPLLWKWQFEETPYAERFNPVILVDDADKVVGFNGIMPIEATEFGVPIDVLWSCDFHVSANMRGQGLGKQIKRTLIEQADIIMSFGVSDQASHVLAKMGWHQSESVYNFRLIREWHSPRMLAFQVLQWANVIRGALCRRSHSGDYSIDVRSQLPGKKAIDYLWTVSKGGFGKTIARTHEYLDWKYQNHPLAQYAFVCAWRDGILLGMLIVRYSRGSLRIVDYLGAARDVDLKRALIRKCRYQWRHARHITTATSDEELGQCLLDEGFFRPRSRPRFFVRTRLKDKARWEDNWFIMAGDSDGELLLAAQDQYSAL
ncbi:GNAT family N-acetyltransferase [Marinobacter sp. V034]|uniref:GNAT family N-acetyltransferase n=1 Tax=Marinobacter sp. V034 TaxID=3459610 RepID=UPI0040440918